MQSGCWIFFVLSHCISSSYLHFVPGVGMKQRWGSEGLVSVSLQPTAQNCGLSTLSHGIWNSLSVATLFISRGQSLGWELYRFGKKALGTWLINVVYLENKIIARWVSRIEMGDFSGMFWGRVGDSAYCGDMPWGLRGHGSGLAKHWQALSLHIFWVIFWACSTVMPSIGGDSFQLSKKWCIWEVLSTSLKNNLLCGCL